VRDDGDTLALRLSAQIDELARALSAAGPIGPDGLRLLESAAIAAMNAVSLDELSRVVPERRGEQRAPSARAFPRAA
jgi:hypothetical protein